MGSLASRVRSGVPQGGRSLADLKARPKEHGMEERPTAYRPVIQTACRRGGQILAASAGRSADRDPFALGSVQTLAAWEAQRVGLALSCPERSQILAALGAQ